MEMDSDGGEDEMLVINCGVKGIFPKPRMAIKWVAAVWNINIRPRVQLVNNLQRQRSPPAGRGDGQQQHEAQARPVRDECQSKREQDRDHGAGGNQMRPGYSADRLCKGATGRLQWWERMSSFYASLPHLLLWAAELMNRNPSLASDYYLINCNTFSGPELCDALETRVFL